MKRLINDYLDYTSSHIFNNSELYHSTSFKFVNNNPAHDPKLSCVYLTVNYNSNLFDECSLDTTNINTDNLNTIPENTSYQDIFYVDNDYIIHEVNNSEFLFDSLFDYIIRGNARINTLGITNVGENASDSITINEDA